MHGRLRIHGRYVGFEKYEKKSKSNTWLINFI